MRTVIALVIAALLAGCSSSSSPSGKAAAPQSSDPVIQKLQQEAGNGATDCGRVKSQTPGETQKAGDCALNAAKDKKPFYVAYDMPGLTVGYAGNSQGKLFSVQSESGENAAQPQVQSAPCPGELRLAQSGRVTCMLPGNMGMGSGGANPHGGMMQGTGQNPHGGIAMPNLGNEGGMGQPSHGSKAPPKK